MPFDFRIFVRDIVRDNDYRRLAEIGVWKGELSRMLWSMASTEYLLLVDPFNAASTGMTEYKTQKEMDAIYETLLRDKPVTTQIMRVPSIEAARYVSDASLDFVFIDALHTREAVTEDINAWLPKIRNGGMIAGDDYSSRFPGVIKAVCKCLPDHVQCDRVWSCRK